MSGFLNGVGGIPTGELCAGLSQLKGEHPPLLEMLDVIYSLTDKIENEMDLIENFTRLKKSVAAFKAELDPHSEREEGVLFPMLGQYIGTTSGPIVAMEYEHDQAKKAISEFLGKGEKIDLSIEEMKNLSALARNAYDILTQHFYKEENVLFPMAERMLSLDEKEELYNKIQKI